jgi:hypothetical protein
MNDKWFRLIGIPLVAALVYLGVEGLPTVLNYHLFTAYAFGLLITTVMWEGNRAIFLFMRRTYPRYDQTGRRLGFQTVASIAFTVGATLLLNQLHQVLLRGPLPPLSAGRNYLVTFLLQLVPTFMITSTYESVFFFGEWKKNLRRSDALARASIQGQLEALQRQLDPHFLFNSLNTLTALIEPENRPAQQFIEQLSDVYRYVLLSRDRPKVPLAEELKFVEAYVALNKTRFGDEIQVVTDGLASALLARPSVAPLSVQMLVENALKHNIISARSPLRLRLHTDGRYVSVTNNVQIRATLPQSTKVGLHNIIERYRLLSERPVRVVREDGLFTVHLPLLDAQ